MKNQKQESDDEEEALARLNKLFAKAAVKARRQTEAVMKRFWGQIRKHMREQRPKGAELIAEARAARRRLAALSQIEPVVTPAVASRPRKKRKQK